MKKIEMGKKYSFCGDAGQVRYVDGKCPGKPVLWESSDSGFPHLFDAFGRHRVEEGPFTGQESWLVEVSPYEDIPIDAPG